MNLQWKGSIHIFSADGSLRLGVEFCPSVDLYPHRKCIISHMFRARFYFHSVYHEMRNFVGNWMETVKNKGVLLGDGRDGESNFT